MSKSHLEPANKTIEILTEKSIQTLDASMWDLILVDMEKLGFNEENPDWGRVSYPIPHIGRLLGFLRPPTT